MQRSLPIRPILMLLLCSLLFRCEEPVDLDVVIPEQILLIRSVMVPGELVTVQVASRSNVIQGITDQPVKDAIVRVFAAGNDSGVDLYFVEGSDGLYRAETFTPTAGVTYEVLVYAGDDFAPTFARSFVPPPSELNKIFTENINRFVSGDRATFFFDFGIEFNDPAGEENYYNLRLTQEIEEFVIHPGNDTVVTNTKIVPFEFPVSDNHDYKLTRDEGGILFIDNPFEDQTIPLRLSIDVTKEKMGVIYAELRTVSRDYYLFEESIASGSVGISGGISTGSSIYSNVDGGGGTVSGYSSNSATLSLGQ